MVGVARHAGVAFAARRPIRGKAKTPVGMAKAFQKMRAGKAWRAVMPAGGVQAVGVGLAALAQHLIHQRPGVLLKSRMRHPQPRGQLADEVMVGAAFAQRRNQRARRLQKGVARGLIQVVVLQKGGGQQHQIGQARSVGHELFVHADKQVVTQQAAPHRQAVRRHHCRIGVLHQQHADRRAIAQVTPFTSQHRAQPAHVQHAGVRGDGVQAVQCAGVQPVQAAVAVQRAAARPLPGAGDRRQTADRVHGRRAIALAGKPITHTQKAAPRAAIQPGKLHNLLDRQAGDLGRPGRRAAGQMGFHLGGEIGVFGQIIPVGQAFGQQHMHHCTGQRAIGAGAQSQVHIGFGGSGGAVGVHHHQRYIAPAPGLY